MYKQEVSFHEEAISHESAVEEVWSDDDEFHQIIGLQPVRFSDKAIQHSRHPVNIGRMEHPDARASRVGWCGEVMEMYLHLDGHRIVEASFWAEGCLSTMACGDMLTTMIQGMTLEDATVITPEELIEALDGLPYKSRHCAELSVETLREAIAGWGKEGRG
jgi:nitrogen fixation protein NifU and related proteins